MSDLLTGVLAVFFAAWVVVDSGALGHWWRLARRVEPFDEFRDALLGCRMCTGFWLSVPLLAFDRSPIEVLALNGAHYALLTIEGAMWRGEDGA